MRFKYFDHHSRENDIMSLVSATKAKTLDLAIRVQFVLQGPDDEPASVLLEHIRAEKEKLIKQGKIKRDKMKPVIFRGEDNSCYKNMDLFCLCTAFIVAVIMFIAAILLPLCNHRRFFVNKAKQRPSVKL